MPPETADISVIVPAYRAAATIGRALGSVAAQTVKPREVIVVDDGSDDDTAAVAESFRAGFGGIELVVIRQNRQGAGAARNRAVAAAKGRLLAFLDADDEWLPAKLEKSLVWIDEDERLFVSHNIVAVAADGREETRDSARHYRAAVDPFLALFRRGFVATSSVVAKRAAVIEAGGFDPALPAAQDYDLWLAIAGRPGRPFAVFDEALTRYHINPTGITANVRERRRGSLEVLRRHAPALRHRGIASIWHVLVRVAIVHVEAWRAHLARGEVGRAAACVLQLLPATVDGLEATTRGETARPDFIGGAASSSPPRGTGDAATTGWRAFAGVAWMWAVIAAYFAYNYPYYVEKISTFGRFLFK